MTGRPAGFAIVLNYRREDTAGHAGRLYDALVREFEEERVFMDIDAIEPGVDFVEVIERAVDSCDAFLSLIGKQWLSVKDPKGRPRLHNPEDYVRMEIEAALRRRGIRVIPVLVQEADMPTSDDLPPSLAPLARRNAIELRDASWRYDVERFVLALREELEGGEKAATTVHSSPRRPPVGPAGRRPFPRVAAAAAAAALVLVALVAFFLLRDGGNDEPQVAGGAGPDADARIAVDVGGRIYFAGGDAAGPTALSGGGFATSPDWSPEGDRLVVSRGGNIWIVNPDGGGEQQLTSGREHDNAPAWSPDGRLIAFDRARPGAGFDVWTVNVDGTGARELTRGPVARGSAPSWSPDSERIAFQSRLQIWVMAADGTSAERVDETVEGAHLFPAWAPDNSRIAFVVTGTGRCEIVLVRPDGGDPRTLTPDGPSECADLAWSPDARRIAFVGDESLWSIARDGSELEKLGEAEGISNPSWGRT